MDVVIDASVALAWCFPDEVNEYADSVLLSPRRSHFRVPSIWSAEVANGVAVGFRRQRLDALQQRRFFDILDELSVTADIPQQIIPYTMRLAELAHEYRLTAYDAAYLELAMRLGAPLATLDTDLRRAASDAGVRLFVSGSFGGSPVAIK